MRKLKIYSASPFFTPAQVQTLEAVEAVLEGFEDVEVFKPRNSKSSARKLNNELGAGKDPSEATRRAVFQDNVDGIVDADLVVAVIDGRDIGTIWECGAAYMSNTPVITYTNEDYGLNLMIANSVIAHCKGAAQLREAIGMFRGQFIEGRIDRDAFEARFKRANLEEGPVADKKLEE